MSSCPTCGNRGYLCQQCKMEELEDRHGTPSDNFDEDSDGVRCWVQAIDETWHASMYFEDTRHVAACGEILETPVAGVKDDPRFVDETRTCEDCEAYLEGDEGETVPDGGEFAPASELRADGGEVDVYQWVLENVHEYPAGTDSRWGSRGNLVHQGRKLDGVTKEDVQVAIAHAVENEDLLSWHGLLARAEIDRLREITRVEHEEHDITRGILVGKCNKLIATKKQEQGDENAEREVATDGGVDQSSSGTDQPNRRKSVQPQGHSFPVPIGRNTPSGSSREAIGFPQSSQIATVVGRSCNAVIGIGDRWFNSGLNRTRRHHVVSTHLLTAISPRLHRTLQSGGDQQ